eukprot:TRINITY_DN4616_c0_g1_i1.p1 TRINITY_DN4616_c0_g1~~TRINITY_DN4616_c0_g1_i1.p1  ORF type:complete len:705 (+),score=137.53 TRINITY_DN4616_c0_g1_i1:47-2161(+)
MREDSEVISQLSSIISPPFPKRKILPDPNRSTPYLHTIQTNVNTNNNNNLMNNKSTTSVTSSLSLSSTHPPSTPASTLPTTFKLDNQLPLHRRRRALGIADQDSHSPSPPSSSSSSASIPSPPSTPILITPINHINNITNIHNISSSINIIACASSPPPPTPSSNSNPNFEKKLPPPLPSIYSPISSPSSASSSTLQGPCSPAPLTGSVVSPTNRFCSAIPPNVRENMTPVEIKRQEGLYEIIETEKNYIFTLQNILSIFTELSTMNSAIRLHFVMIYSTLKLICVHHQRLFRDLDSRQRESVDGVITTFGDIFLDRVQIAHFEVYSVYCSCYPAFLGFVDKFSLKFPEVKSLVQERKVHNLLIQPLQRLCRYPLMLQGVIDRTPEDDEDLQSLKAAKGEFEKIIEYVDERGAEAKEFLGEAVVSSPSPSPLRKIKKPLLDKRRDAVDLSDLSNEKTLEYVVQLVEQNCVDELLEGLSENNFSKSRLKEIVNIIVNKKSLLHIATLHGHHHICRLLIQYGADVNSRDDKEWTPLHVACASAQPNTKHYEIIQILLQKNSDVFAESSDKCVSLHYFFNNENNPLKSIEIITHMLDCGLNINHCNKAGETVLHYSCRGGVSKSVFDYLLMVGADPFILAKRGSSVMDYCLLFNRPKLISSLAFRYPTLLRVDQKTLKNASPACLRELKRCRAKAAANKIEDDKSEL